MGLPLVSWDESVAADFINQAAAESFSAIAAIGSKSLLNLKGGTVAE